MKRKYRYAFAMREETEGGRVAALAAALSTLTFFAGIILSAACGGQAGRWIGALGLMGVGFSAYGFATGLKGFAEKEKSYRLTLLGSLACGILLVCWLAVFLIGI